jgi:ribosomal protein S18 acetylase RimI-like enzyme
MGVDVEHLKTFTHDIVPALNGLLSQLHSDSEPLNDRDAREIIEGSSNSLFVARDHVDNKIVGMIILVIYRIPVWKKGWIEDLVVDKGYRGHGIAEKLISCAIENAKKDGVSSLNFTSRPERETANRLYERLGFEKRDTNVYRIKF